MSNNQKKGGSNSRKNSPSSRSTEHATPTLAGMIQSLSVGPALEKQLETAFARLGQPFDTNGVSTSWAGAERLAKQLAKLGCYLEMQTHSGRCFCRVLRALKGNAVAKQLASMEAPSLPEAVAKASLLSLVEMQPPTA
jgi:hypothetical protein